MVSKTQTNEEFLTNFNQVYNNPELRAIAEAKYWIDKSEISFHDIKNLKWKYNSDGILKYLKIILSNDVERELINVKVRK
jgi:hypothetical protein